MVQPGKMSPHHINLLNTYTAIFFLSRKTTKIWLFIFSIAFRLSRNYKEKKVQLQLTKMQYWTAAARGQGVL